MYGQDSGHEFGGTHHWQVHKGIMGIEYGTGVGIEQVGRGCVYGRRWMVGILWRNDEFIGIATLNPCLRCDSKGTGWCAEAIGNSIRLRMANVDDNDTEEQEQYQGERDGDKWLGTGDMNKLLVRRPLRACTLNALRWWWSSGRRHIGVGTPLAW